MHMDMLSSTTCRRLRYIGVTLFALIAIWSICAWSNAITVKVTPTPRFTPTFPGSYAATLTSPNGSVTVLRECIFLGLQELCAWHLSNGNVIPDVARIYWSADNHYAVICHHTEECFQGYAVWDMTNGTKLNLQIKGTLPSFKWQPTGNLLAYYPTGASTSYEEPRRLTIFDPQTGEVMFPDKCPAWLSTDSNGAYFEGGWKQLCVEAFQPTPTSAH